LILGVTTEEGDAVGWRGHCRETHLEILDWLRRVM